MDSIDGPVLAWDYDAGEESGAGIKSVSFRLVNDAGTIVAEQMSETAPYVFTLDAKSLASGIFELRAGATVLKGGVSWISVKGLDIVGTASPEVRVSSAAASQEAPRPARWLEFPGQRKKGGR